MSPFPPKAPYCHEQMWRETVQQGDEPLGPAIGEAKVGGVLGKEVHGLLAVVGRGEIIDGCPHHRIEGRENVCLEFLVFLRTDAFLFPQRPGLSDGYAEIFGVPQRVFGLY